MRAVVFADADAGTALSQDLQAGIAKALGDAGWELQIVELERDRVAPCRGCFLCATAEYRGGCVTKDAVGRIKKDLRETDLTIHITPVVFGHYSSVVKNAVDRGGGSREWQVVIGYGSDIDDEERRTFIDLTAKHRGRADIVHPGMDARVDVFVTQSVEENAALCDRLRTDLGCGKLAA